MAYGPGMDHKKGLNVTGFLTPIFVLDRFTASAGSKTYSNPPPGKSLHALCSWMPLNNDNYINLPVPTVTINGNTVSWSNLYTGLGSYIYTYWG